jgi:hypothetical protein
MKIFHEILTITLALTIAAYSSATLLTAQPNPVNSDRTIVIDGLTQTGNNGSRTTFVLLGVSLRNRKRR